jgi:hypothetical protein
MRGLGKKAEPSLRPLSCYPLVKTNMLVANVKDSICRLQSNVERKRQEQKTFLNKKETKVAKFQTPKKISLGWSARGTGLAATRFVREKDLLPLLSFV